jgi:hypothetical protein
MVALDRLSEDYLLTMALATKKNTHRTYRRDDPGKNRR